MPPSFDQPYWTNRYAQNRTQWDTGGITPPLQAYIDQLTNKNQRILIPGAGNAYEAEYLWRQGFANTFVADFAPAPLANLKQRCPDFPAAQLLLADFFELTGSYDLILEQTFFCALAPSLRPAYARQCYRLLVPNGRLAGVLFDTHFEGHEPPFGGTVAEYRSYFEPYFRFRHFSPCNNSLKPRQNRELFMVLESLPTPGESER